MILQSCDKLILDSYLFAFCYLDVNWLRQLWCVLNIIIEVVEAHVVHLQRDTV